MGITKCGRLINDGIINHNRKDATPGTSPGHTASITARPDNPCCCRAVFGGGAVNEVGGIGGEIPAGNIINQAIGVVVFFIAGDFSVIVQPCARQVVVVSLKTKVQHRNHGILRNRVTRFGGSPCIQSSI